MTTKGIYHTLVTQLDKLARHNRQGSFRTKDRYYEAVKRFCAYLAAHYHLQKLENISGKLIGHATAAFTLDVYGHVTDQMKRESADRMERFIRTVSAG